MLSRLLSRLRRNPRPQTRRATRRRFFESLEARRVMAIEAYYVPLLTEITEGENANWIIDIQGTDGDYPWQYLTPITVNYSLSATTDSAKPGIDYTDPAPKSITVTGGAQAVSIPTIDDTDYRGDRIITLTIESGSGYTVPNPGPYAILIHDNDLPEGGNPIAVTGGCPTCPPPANPIQLLGTNSPAARSGALHSFADSGFSSHPVRYSDGTVYVSATDIQSDGFGVPWGVTREWTNGVGYARHDLAGNSTTIAQQPVLFQPYDFMSGFSTSTLGVVLDGRTARYFDLSSGVYRARDFVQESIVYDSGSDEYVYTTASGAIARFYGFAATNFVMRRGQLKSFTDQFGNAVNVVSHAVDGRYQEVQRSYTTGGDTITESYHYAYVASGDNWGLLSSVALRRKVNSGSWSTVRKAEYEYYDGVESHGNLGDLKLATVKDGANNILDRSYYRYYVASESGGYQGGLKYAVYPQSFERLVAAEGSTLSAIADEDLAPFADHYFEYDSWQRATKEIAQGAGCSTCNGGQGSFTYAYTTSSNDDGYNNWKYKTIETLPDGNQNIVYANFRGQVMLKVYQDTTTNEMWATYSRFDTSGRVLFNAQASAVSGFDDNYADLVNFDEFGNAQYLRDSAGLLTNYSYSTSTTATTSTPGNVLGYVHEVSIQEGETGTAIPQQTTTYIARTAGSSTIYLPAMVEAYEDNAGIDEVTTSYAYTFYSGTTQIESTTTTLPTGSGPDSQTVFFDTYGRPVWMKDARGYLHYTEYDNKTGAVTKTIADVDAAQTSDFSGKPSGWTTPGGGGVHAITSYEVDDLGRPTKITDPNGNVTYTVYDDTNHEIRIYPGWDTGTSAPTGPTIVVREDRDASYTEVLTMSAAPTVSSGRPTGAEAIGSLQSLTRTHVNSAGQAVYVDEYVSFASLSYSTSASLGTEGTHFHRTEQAYDKRGRASRAERADGTIYRTVFDGLGRPVSEWIGTNDTPVSGFWSPTNAAGMQQIKEYLYDGDDIGDGYLTSVEDANGNVTSLAYDFRGRMLTTTLPDPDGGGSLASPEYETAYDNLGRIVSQTDALNVITYFTHNLAGRTVSITVPDSDGAGPDTAYTKSLVYDATGNLTVQSTELTSGVTMTYDGLGRVTRITQADPDGAGSLAAPYTDYAYDDVRNVRFITDPLGNVTEYQYDKANRLVKIIQEDPDAGGSLTAPETDYVYDAAGFVASVTDPLDRTVSYTYDRLGRKLTETLPDPDAGGSLTAPVTTWTYDAVGRVASMTDPRSQTTDYAYDLFDRLIAETLPDPDGGGSLARPETSYTYDDVGNLLTLTDPVVNVTTWVYDNLNRQISEENELGDFRYFAYDANSNLTNKTDRNGRVIDYVYDARNRLIEERWKNGGSTIRTLAFGYDGDSRLVSASDPAADYDYTYDDLGRVTSEVQDLDGLTPNITYASAFNVASLMTQLTATIGSTADFKNTYAYDDLNRLTQLLQQGQSGGNAVAVKRVDFDYNAAGQYTQLRRYQDASATEHAGTTNYGYDDIGRLLKLTHHDQVTALASGTSWGTGILAGYQYTWDGASRITAINNYVDGSISYSYDNTDQLTSADNPSPLADESYTYDENGNRTMSGYTVGDNNQVTSDGTYNYTYDDEGNLLTKTTIATSAKEEYTWDYRNRLTKVTFKDGSNNVLKTVEYAYDVFDRLVRRTYDSDGPGGTSATDQFFSFMGDSINPALQFDGASSSELSHRYLWGDLVDQLLADEKVTSLSSAGNILWPAWDHLNSTRDLIDRNESTSAVTVINHRIFDGFGQLTSESSPANTLLFGFTGKLYDPVTGNQLNWKRWLRSSLGRWLIEDPIGFRAGDANLSRYVSNSATIYGDPSGLDPGFVDWPAPNPNPPNKTVAIKILNVLIYDGDDDKPLEPRVADCDTWGQFHEKIAESYLNRRIVNEVIRVRKNDTWADIERMIRARIGRNRIGTLYIFDHGWAAEEGQMLGDEILQPGDLGKVSDLFLGINTSICLRGCGCGNYPQYNKSLANKTGATIVSYRFQFVTFDDISVTPPVYDTVPFRPRPGDTIITRPDNNSPHIGGPPHGPILMP